MSNEEILIVQKDKDKMRFKVGEKKFNQWSPKKYEKVIASKDYNMIAYLFYDLYTMGYSIPKAYKKFLELLGEPELFFL